MPRHPIGLLVVLTMTALGAVACDDPPPMCEAGMVRECPCGGGVMGTQVCEDDGSCWLECRCDGSDGDADSDVDADVDVDTDGDVEVDADNDVDGYGDSDTDVDSDVDADVDSDSAPPLRCGSAIWEGDVYAEDIWGMTDEYAQVTGDVVLHNSALENIEPLRCIRSIRGMLIIGGNRELTSLHGLRSLERVGGEEISVGGNLLIEDLDSLVNLSGDVQNLSIVGNRNLRRIGALAGLYCVDHLRIQDNPYLPSCDVDQFARIFSSRGCRPDLQYRDNGSYVERECDDEVFSPDSHLHGTFRILPPLVSECGEATFDIRDLSFNLLADRIEISTGSFIGLVWDDRPTTGEFTTSYTQEGCAIYTLSLSFQSSRRFTAIWRQIFSGRCRDCEDMSESLYAYRIP